MTWPKARGAEDGVKVSKKAKVESTTTFLCYECCTSLMGIAHGHQVETERFFHEGPKT
jgi:hypothetical protein